MILGCDIRLRMSSSRRADEAIRSAGASSTASRRTTLIAMYSGRVPSRDISLEVAVVSNGSARMTLEKLPRPRDFTLMYRIG